MGTLSTQSSLLFRLRTREDSAAWTRFVRLYSPLIQHWVGQFKIESHCADDLVQEIFVTLLGKVSFLAHRRPDSFRGWLRTVTMNRCRDHFRKLDQKSYAQALETIELAIADPQDQRIEAEYRLFVAESALRLMQEYFSQTTWQACWQHVVEGKSAQEIATALEISPNAVYLARARVMKRLREELAGLWE